MLAVWIVGGILAMCGALGTTSAIVPNGFPVGLADRYQAALDDHRVVHHGERLQGLGEADAPVPDVLQ